MKKKLEKIALQIPQKIFVDLQDVLKMSSKHVLRTSWRYLQRNNFSSCKYIFKTSWMHLQDMSFEYILKKSWKTRNCSVEDFFKTCLEGIFKMYLEIEFQTFWKPTKCLLEKNLYLFLTNLVLLKDIRFPLQALKSLATVWCCKTNWIK